VTPLRIGIAGLGTVGGGVLQILEENAELLASRSGRPIVVHAVSARNRNKDRGIDTSKLRWLDNPLEMAGDPHIDVVVELIGGAEGIARELVEKALLAGKSVVTANKALIAHHGLRLAEMAEKTGAMLAFEASVAGGIPIIKALRDGLAANKIHHIAGILNGTCNYIITSMSEKNCSFDEALKEAQRLGYAEAEPSFDVDGIDTAHKLAILTSLAYGVAPSLENMHVEGIRRISLRDMRFVAELGYTIRLLGIASQTPRGIEQRVHPCLVPLDSPLGTVQGVYNAISVTGSAVGTVFFEGRGAGAGPTASSVMADVMDIARGVAYKPFAIPVQKLKVMSASLMEDLYCSYYLRLAVVDRPGVLSEVTSIFKSESISLRSFIQHSHALGEVVQVVGTTHETQESAMLRAMAAIGRLESVKEEPYMIRIENI
jgi:homoserine dehydrogenase